MDNTRNYPYHIDDSNNAHGSGGLPTPASHERRTPRDQGAAATVVSGTDGDQQMLIGVLELLECATQGSMTVSDMILWFDENLVKPGYMRPPTRVFENGVGTVYLGATRTRRQLQEVTLHRVLEVARKEVCAVLSGMLENPPDDRFITYQIVTGRVYPVQIGLKRVWRVQARHDDRLSGILLSLLGANIMSNQRTYYERMSVCSECGRISFRLDTNDRRRCSAHATMPPSKKAI